MVAGNFNYQFEAKLEHLRKTKERFWSGLDFSKYPDEQPQTLSCPTIGDRVDYLSDGVIAEDVGLDLTIITDGVRQIYVRTMNNNPDTNSPRVCEVAVAELQDQESLIKEDRYVMVLYKDKAADFSPFNPKYTYYGLLIVANLNNAYPPRIITKDFQTGDPKAMLGNDGIWANQISRENLVAWGKETPIEISGQNGLTIGSQAAELGRIIVDGAIQSLNPVSGKQDAGIPTYKQLSYHLLNRTELPSRNALQWKGLPLKK